MEPCSLIATQYNIIRHKQGLHAIQPVCGLRIFGQIGSRGFLKEPALVLWFAFFAVILHGVHPMSWWMLGLEGVKVWLAAVFALVFAPLCWTIN
jgi:hypothetical protein